MPVMLAHPSMYFDGVAINTEDTGASVVSKRSASVTVAVMCLAMNLLFLLLFNVVPTLQPPSPQAQYVAPAQPMHSVLRRGDDFVARRPLTLPHVHANQAGGGQPQVEYSPVGGTLASVISLTAADIQSSNDAPQGEGPHSRRSLDIGQDVLSLLPIATVAVLALFMSYTFRKLMQQQSAAKHHEHHMTSKALASSRPLVEPLSIPYDFPSKVPLAAPHIDGPSQWSEPPTRLADIFTDEDEFEELEILPVSDLEFREEAVVVEYDRDARRPPVQRYLKNKRQCKALAHYPLDSHTLRWVNVTGNQNALKLPILQAYKVHPLFIEDILNEAERSKVENLGSHDLVFLFQSVNVVEETADDDEDTTDDIRILRLEMNQVSLILRDYSLLSFFTAPTKTVEQCKALIASRGGKLRTTSTHWLMHTIIDKEVDRLFPIMNRYRSQLETIQRALDNRRPSRTGNPNVHYGKILRALQTTSQEMNNLIFVLRPLASSVASLTEHAKNLGMRELQWHFNDLRDHIATILDYVASMQAWARALKDDYSYIQQDSMNRTMYVLTLITALFIPAQFLTGLFGMNFQYMPWLTWKYGFWAFWALIAVINGAIVYMFKKIRWL